MKQLLPAFRRPGKTLFITLCVACISCTPIERIPERSMGVTMGPELVFERPIAEIVPQLATATATGSNGRVGNEFVFWGYQLQDNSNVNLFACAVLDNVNCEVRINAVCPANTELLVQKIEPGMVRHLDCRAVGIAGVGDLRPNCEDEVQSNDLLVGLLQCR